MKYRSWVSAFILLAGVLFSPNALRAAPGDEHWDPQFGWPGVTDPAYGIAEYNGQLYVGGSSITGTASNTTLNAWNGSNWSSFASISGRSGTIVYDLASTGSALYVAGYFTNVAGAPITGLAKWDGNSWSDLGFSGVGVTLAIDGNNLYVGGVFTNIGAVAATNIAYWDGNIWHALGNGLGGSNDAVRAIVVTNGFVYAGGNFTNSGSLAITNTGCWNGAAWSQLGGGLNSYVYSLAAKGNDLFAGGFFSQAGATPANRIARWNGSDWSALGSGVIGSGNVNSLAVFGDNVCAGGTFTNIGGTVASRFAVWNGSNWAAASSGLSSSVARVKTIATNVYVGGIFTLAGGMLVNQIAAWDGSNWKAFRNSTGGNGASSVARAFGGGGTNFYMGGTFIAIGGIAANRIARFDGTNYFPLGSGLNSTVQSIAVNGNDIYVAGDFTTAGGVAANHIARWDGVSWSQVGGGIPGTVSVLAMRGTDLLVGGNFQISTLDGTATGIARWDGVNWRKFGGFLFNMPISGIGVVAIHQNGNDVYLGGQFSAANSDTFLGSDNIIRYDGVDWQPMGSGVNSNVLAIASIGSDIYVGGRMTNASGVTVGRMAKWNGANWSNVGGGLFGTGSFSVQALAAIGSNLYAGGTFTNAGGLNVNRIAQWNGTSWSALGSGVIIPNITAASVSTFAVQGNDLYVSGVFERAGGKPSYNLGRWNDQIDFGVVASIQLGKVRGTSTGPFKFSITTVGISSYVIEATTNYVNWTPLETNSASFHEYWDFGAPTRPFRFYRVRSQP
ncbi:MAG: hypothetical protein ABIR24_00135 [Verrucomicrobiota bacterium]